MCPRRMTPRRTAQTGDADGGPGDGRPRRTSPRRVAQTGGADGWPWEEKPGRKGPPLSWLFVPGTSFCAIGLGPPLSLKPISCQTNLKTIIRGRPPETEVPETEEGQDGGRPRRMSPRWMSRDGCVFLLLLFFKALCQVL